MQGNSLSTIQLAKKNIKQKKWRTIGLVFLVSLFAFALLTGTMFGKSLERGMNNLANRMGADIMAVPYGYDSDIEGALLRGEPSSFYFDSEFTEKIAAVEGVANVSPQLYLATLSSGCCSYPLQLIGFDPETDFTVQSWLDKGLNDELTEGEIIVGHNINAEIGQKLTFFNRDYIVAGRLEKTGMGFDTSVFMNLSTAQTASEDMQKISSTEIHSEGISSVMVQIEAGYTVKDVANEILQSYAVEGVSVVTTKNMMNTVSNNLKKMTSFLYVFVAIIWVLAILVMAITFNLIINSRTKEFSMYRVLGATKRRLSAMIFCEASLISALGAFIGVGLGMIIIFPFSNYISSILEVPYLIPSYSVIVLIAIISLVVSFSVGPIVSIIAARKISKGEIYTTMREND